LKGGFFMDNEHMMSNDEKMWGMLCHLAALSGFFFPVVGNIVGPLIVYLLKREEYAFVNEQGKESLNFQISVLIYSTIAAFLVLLIIGFILLPIVGLFALIYTIVASIKAHNGEHFRYPLTIRFLK
jgi:uncharacterized protein